MTKKKTLISENVIRRWGKLAAMPALTENWLTEQEEEMEMDAEMDMDDDGEEVEMDMDMEVEEGAPALDLDAEQVEVLVQGIADKLSELTGEEVDVEADEEVDMDIEMDAEVEDLADDDAAMRDHAYNRKDEILDVDVIDDEDLTEAVLSRVVERLLRRG